ncbi:hypothetical protein ES702_04926 [subsurface metagenome]
MKPRNIPGIWRVIKKNYPKKGVCVALIYARYCKRYQIFIEITNIHTHAEGYYDYGTALEMYDVISKILRA